MKDILLLALFFTILFQTNAQSRYVLNDGKEVTNCLIREGSENVNCLRFYVWEKGEYIVYEPNDIKEYHIDNRKSFYSMPIVLEDSTVMRFVQKIVDGETKLYCYYIGQFNLFIVQNADTTVQFVRKTFRDKISQVVSACPEKSEEIINQLPYNIDYLQRFVKQYNNNCRFTPLNLKRFGYLAGANAILSVNPSYYLPSSIGERMSLNFGVFIEEPIYASDFSFHGELSYAGIQLKKSKEVLFNKYREEAKPKAVDSVLYNSFFKQHSLNLPLMIRYYLPIHHVRPFVNAGMQLSLNLTSNSYEDRIPYRSRPFAPLEYQIVKNLVYSRLQPSILFGAGIAFSLDRERMAYLECRYSKLFDVVIDDYGSTKLSFLASLSF